MAKHAKAIQTYHLQISEIYNSFPKLTNKELAEKLLSKYTDISVSVNTMRQTISAWKKANKNEEPATIVEPTPSLVNKDNKRSGLESRGDHIVINWANKTIITDLGEYGNYVASFDRHNLIQRKYVYSHGNETGAVVAMEFDFPHTKAVYQYAKHHGFTKSSPGQTDLEFEMGLTVEDAVEENIQTMKRRTYKKTQKREWEETLKAASKWWKFEDTTVEAIQALALEKQVSYDQLDFIIPQNEYKFASLIGISDAHYMKLCYNHLGEVVYDRAIALERIKDHVQKLAAETARFGRPERFYVIIGNDNMHVDGMHHSTTKLTPQNQATDGLWRLELKNYMQLQIDIINYYKQIAPVVVIPVKGNHDYQTSIAIQAFAEIHFADDELVDILINHDARTYHQYGKVCIIATHGDELGSVNNLENKAHQIIMGEAKLHGINVQEVEYYILIHGHEHVGSYRDLNGCVQRIGLPSLSGTDDWWHKEKGYVGRQPESNTIIIDHNKGRKAILYA